MSKHAYIFDFGSDHTLDGRPNDDVTLCVEVPADNEQDAREKLVAHLDARAGMEDPSGVPFVVDEDGIQFRFYINKALSDVTVADIGDARVVEELTRGQ